MTTPPNAPEVDVLAFFDDAEKIWTDAHTGANADTIGGVTMESVKEACARIEGRLRNVRQVRTAVADLLIREAALAAERDALAAGGCGARSVDCFADENRLRAH